MNYVSNRCVGFSILAWTTCPFLLDKSKKSKSELINVKLNEYKSKTKFAKLFDLNNVSCRCVGFSILGQLVLICKTNLNKSYSEFESIYLYLNLYNFMI